MQQGRSSLAVLFAVLVIGGALLYGVVVLTGPWAVHIGGRWTPLLTWQGSGKLMTKGGIEYPLYVSFYPSSHFSSFTWTDSVPPEVCRARPGYVLREA